jgi:hypothetical protein
MQPCAELFRFPHELLIFNRPTGWICISAPREVKQDDPRMLSWGRQVPSAPVGSAEYLKDRMGSGPPAEAVTA